MAFDLLISDCLLIDGTGRPRYRADLGVNDGKITAIGRLGNQASRVIDAAGRALAPGIVDTHCHYDAQVLWDPTLTSSCWHGVTSVVIGNCGFTLAPCRPEDRSFLMSLLARVEDMSSAALAAGLDWSWVEFEEYLARINRGLGLNLAAFVGHSALRRFVMGEAASERAASEDEVASMAQVLRSAVSAGAVGFSTSIGPTHADAQGRPVPSRLAGAEELLALASALGEFNCGSIGIIPQGLLWGLTDQDKQLLEQMSVVSGRPVQWNGFNYRWDHPESHRDAIAFMEGASARGAQVYGLTRLFGSDRQFSLRRTTFFDGLELWRETMATPLEQRPAIFADLARRPAFRQAIDTPGQDAGHGQLRPRIRWQAVTVARSPSHPEWEGRSVSELAQEQDRHIADVILDLALSEDLSTEFQALRTLAEDEASMAEIIRHPNTILGNSDAGAHVNSDCIAGESTYCLSYWTRERGVLQLEDAIRRLTSVPASLYGFADRGEIRLGYAADLMIFDPDTVDICPKALVRDFPGDETRYVQKAQGISHTIVNGQVVVENGELTGCFPGRLLSGR